MIALQEGLRKESKNDLKRRSVHVHEQDPRQFKKSHSKSIPRLDNLHHMIKDARQCLTFGFGLDPSPDCLTLEVGKRQTAMVYHASVQRYRPSGPKMKDTSHKHASTGTTGQSKPQL